jgi:hypothetical protein
MKKMKQFVKLILITSLIAIAAILPGCQGQPSVTYSLPELKYKLIANFGNVFYCDPDVYPIARTGQEQQNAVSQFPAIKSDTAEFAAILQRLTLQNKADYTDNEKLLIYREHKKLTYGVETTLSGANYNFIVRVGEGQGQRIEGNITPSGKINVSRKAASFNTCPVCLSKGTLIDTLGGNIPVEKLNKGMGLWSVDKSGKRVLAVIIEISSTEVSSSFQTVTLTLKDGRSVTTSPMHPRLPTRPRWRTWRESRPARSWWRRTRSLGSSPR